MSDIKELREQKEKLAAKLDEFRTKLADKSQKWTDEDESNWSAVNADYDDVAARCEKLGRIGQIEKAENESREALRRIGRDDFRAAQTPSGEVTDEHRGLALRSWFTAPKRKLSDIELDACQRVGLDPFSPEMEIRIGDTEQARQIRSEFLRKENRALSSQIGASGGFTVGDGLLQSLEVALLAWGGMRQVAEVIRTSTGATIPYPTTNDTSNTGELIAENTAVSTQDVTFGAVNLSAHQYSSKMVKVPVTLLEDSAFNIPTLLGGMLGERLGRITNTHFTTGDGAAKPRGITTMSTAGKTAASATAITMDEILDLIDSVDEAYLNGASFMFKRATLTALRKLKNGDGDYLWQRGVGGAPDQLWGFPYTTNTDMPSIATGAKTVLFGQLSKYKIREVNSLRLRRLVERYAEYDQEAFVAFIRNDGVLVDAGTHPVKHLVQA